MKNSIWSETSQKPNFEALKTDLDCDVLVIGGGMAGILTAHLLKEQGRDVVVVEAETIGGGITKNTTAAVTAQHDFGYSKLIKMHGRNRAKDYLEANLQAVEKFRTLAEQIDCDFETKPSYQYSLDKDLSEEFRALQSLGYRAEWTKETGLPFPVESAIKFPDMAQFHPLKFLYALAKDLKIYEHTFIEDLQYHTAFTKTQRIKFRQAVVATHFPFVNRTGWFFLKMFQKRSYVVALEGAGDVGGTYIDRNTDGFYLRNFGDYLLVGKGDHRTGTKTDALDQLKSFAKKYYPNSPAKYAWGNQDCVTLDGVPYVGAYGRLKDVYTLTGFNLWGMTGAMVGAQILADLTGGRENPFAETFRSKRHVFRIQLIKNLGVVLKNWVRPTLKRCPHLGCALVYNKREHSWDCQCHGSRFEKNGKLIDNPAMKNADVD